MHLRAWPDPAAEQLRPKLCAVPGAGRPGPDHEPGFAGHCEDDCAGLAAQAVPGRPAVRLEQGQGAHYKVLEVFRVCTCQKLGK